MKTCQHHWLLSSPVNDFSTSTATIPQRCKKCGVESTLIASALDSYSLGNHLHESLVGLVVGGKEKAW